MNVKRIDHIAIVVPDIEQATIFYTEALGMTVTHVERVDDQEVIVAFLPSGDTEIELLEPLNTTSGVAKFLEKRGPGIHHICVEVDDLDGTLANLKARGVQLINEEPVIGSGGRRIAFIHPKSAFGVLVEFYEARPDEADLRANMEGLGKRLVIEGKAVTVGFSAFVRALREAKSEPKPEGIVLKGEGEVIE